METITNIVVVKVGTSTLTGGSSKLNRQRVLDVVQQIAKLHQSSVNPILVTSGALAAGRERVGSSDLHRSKPNKQMLCAVGQSRLMHLYSNLFDLFEISVGQVLLTREDLSDRFRYINVRDTIQTLIENRIVPIINENDTTATQQAFFGDNDYISALVATQIQADRLIILTDQAGLFDKNPSKNEAAQLIHTVHEIDKQLWAIAEGTRSDVGTGGMHTKLQAAQLAMVGGVEVIIASGKEPDVLGRLVLHDEQIGTRFVATENKIESRKRWLLAEKPGRNGITIDAGAVNALKNKGASLLAAGLVGVQGDFYRGDIIAVFGPNGRKIAHGMVNYSSEDLSLLYGINSDHIAQVLGFSYGDTIIHRDNMVFV